MKKRLFMALFFGCFGMATEVFFVAFTHLFNGEQLWEEPLWSLTGKTYVWMFPIYALIPFFAGFLYDRVAKYNLVIRLLLYTTIIFVVEFVAGFMLDQLTGKCPWEYSGNLAIMGYIRLDYAPFWMGFSFIIEKLYTLIDRRYI